MKDSLIVILEDAIAGTLIREANGQLRFEYSADYRKRPEPTPVSLSMPVQLRVHPDRVVAPWLWGLLPDNDAVLARWARQFHVSASSPFALLGSPVGEDCAGAVRFVDEDDVDRALGRTGDISWVTEDEVAQLLADLRVDTTAWLGRTFTGQFSLAGAQAKTALLFRNGKWGIPSGSNATTHILKPAVADFDDHDLNEHLCLEAARRTGLPAVKTRVSRFGKETAIVVDRYDRRFRDDEVVRIHQEDLCQALSVHPSRKYQNEGGPSPITIAELLRQAMPTRVAEESVRRFADALIWNWLIAGTDAHAKNYSLLLLSSDVRLAPLYDVASALPYGIHERKLRLAMKIGGEYTVAVGRNRWPKAAKELGLPVDELVGRVRAMAMLIADAFRDAASSPEVQALGSPLPANLVDLVAKRAERCANVVTETVPAA